MEIYSSGVRIDFFLLLVRKPSFLYAVFFPFGAAFKFNLLFLGLALQFVADFFVWVAEY